MIINLQDKKVWHRYFVLFPKAFNTVEGPKLVWLETIWRRKAGDGFFGHFYEYSKEKPE